MSSNLISDLLDRDKFIEETLRFYYSDCNEFVEDLLSGYNSLKQEDKKLLLDRILAFVYYFYIEYTYIHSCFTILFNKNNFRKRNLGGYVGNGFHRQMKDVFIDFLKKIPDEKLDTTENIENLVFKSLRPLRLKRNMFPGGARITFRPSRNYIKFENGSFLNLTPNIFPFFEEDLQESFNFLTKLSREYSVGEDDSIVDFISRVFNYKSSNGIKLTLDFFKENKLELKPEILTDPIVLDVDHIWEIKNPLGKCSYRVIKEKRRSRVYIEITLYIKSIYNCSKRLNINPYDLLLLVYIHELGHYVYFSGTPLLGQQFYPFNDNYDFSPSYFGDAHFHECIAQFISYKLCSYDNELLEVFHKLNNNQSIEYSHWREIENWSPAMFSDRLCEINKKNTKKIEDIIL